MLGEDTTRSRYYKHDGLAYIKLCIIIRSPSIMKLLQVWILFGVVQLGVEGRPFFPRYSKLLRRGSQSILDNMADFNYYMNLTLGGAQFTVMIDTGR